MKGSMVMNEHQKDMVAKVFATCAHTIYTILWTMINTTGRAYIKPPISPTGEMFTCQSLSKGRGPWVERT